MAGVRWWSEVTYFKAAKCSAEMRGLRVLPGSEVELRAVTRTHSHPKA